VCYMFVFASYVQALCCSFVQAMCASCASYMYVLLGVCVEELCVNFALHLHAPIHVIISPTILPRNKSCV